MAEPTSPDKGKAKHEHSDQDDQMTSPEPIHPPSYRPEYMTVGSGIQPSHAAALMDQLERDSGYGSMPGDNQQTGGEMRSWEDQLLVDRPTPAHTPQINGQPAHMSDTEKRALAGHVHQLYYNQNRVALAKAIGQTVELLKQLQEMNAQWPAHYPSVQRSEEEKRTSRPSLTQTQSTRDTSDFPHDLAVKKLGRPGALRRYGTSIGEDSSSAESSQQIQRTGTPEPRLITPQIAQEFSILKLDLKVGALSQAELVHSLEKKSIASLLDGKIGQSVRHLLALRDRIEDTSSKVLVTGDLNAGKSTFCNALLRRKILPEDQQPCTSIFCEVLDAKENGGLEEVHAVHKEAVYDRNDESTYDVFSLHELDKIVVDNDRYMQCKVYVKDIRTIDQSLLNNGVVDIALIDAPGLNSDSVKTTAVFARQEEIDVVVFVVSAANHFTLSAKEFIWQAAHEKAYIFMVVNGFDNIRDKERCQKLILEQLGHLSPQTFKEAKELVHFVSSNAIPTQPALPSNSGGGGDGGGGSDPSPPDDDDNDDSGKGKGKDKEKIQDFEMLESALRRFVLEKRARSKLAPAKTYLINCLGDMNVLATVNRDVAGSELERVSKELSEIEPEYEERSKQRGLVSEQLEKDIDSTATEVYNHTRSTLSSTIANVGNGDHGVEYPGLLSAFQYAEDLRVAMLDQISAAVTQCEAYGRSQTVKGVNMVKSLGLLHVGDSYENLTFQADRMFQRRRDALVRTVDTDVELWDFFDVAGLWERQEKTVGTGLALTVVGTVGSRAIGGVGWVDGAFGAAKVIGSRNLRRLIVPGFVAAAIVAVAYILSTIPQTLPPRLASKLSATLSQMDYTHSNSARIASEVRRVLRFPAQRLSGDLQSGVEELRKKKEDVTKIKKESEVARKYFGNLVRDSSETRRRVSGIDLEGTIPGAAAAHLCAIIQVFKLAGTTDRRTSAHGGFLNRVFGNKKDKDVDSDSPATKLSIDSNKASPANNLKPSDQPTSPKSETLARQSSEETSTASPTGDNKKRRSSSSKAKEIFTQAKNSLIHGDRDGPQTPMQKLSKTDAALSVPQGSLNNSAGESQPTPNSSFRVGVTEDKNKKCRRTMEDTHSYLYNFLGTPAPVVPSDAALTKKSSIEERASLSTVPSTASQHVVETDNGYFAIFDGHAGTFAAEWCGKKLHVILEDLMRKYPNTAVPELLDQTYTSADNQLEKLPLKNSGCTAITAVLRWEDRVPTNHSATGSQAIAPLAAAAAKEAEKNEPKDATPRSNSTAEAAAAAIQEAKQKATRQRVLYTANVGDARIVLCRNGKALRLSYDHKGMDENEGRRISKAGGLILNNRVNGVLAVTRALGDSYLKDLVTGHPYTTETVIQPDQDEFLILACDGLWDVCSDQEAVDLIRQVNDPQEASKMLVDYALARFSTDNLSVMIVRFDSQKLQSNTKIDIGVETDANKDTGAISEVEMIVAEARRNSGIAPGGTISDQDSEELKQNVIKEHEDEDQEPGPELTPEGQQEAEKVLSEKQEKAKEKEKEKEQGSES